MKAIKATRLFILTPVFILLQLFQFSVILASNQLVTNNLKNLSQGLLTTEDDDFNPEMVIEGNTIHAVWTNRAGNTDGYLFYSRSTDLGETWETPQQIWQYKDGGYATEVVSRKLAVSGNEVYLCFPHFDYYDRNSDGLYLAKSSNNGESFSEPAKLDFAGTGVNRIESQSFIKAKDSEVAILYRIADHEDRTVAINTLYSSDGGSNFSKTTVTTERNNLADFWYDGDQMIVVHSYSYYYYGLNTGRVYVSVSNDDGSSFNTHKVSTTYIEGTDNVREKCICTHSGRYIPKLIRDDSNIHLVFQGNNEQGVWTVLYARSTNNGQTFEKAVDINKATINNIQSDQETLTAKEGNVYLSYLSTSSKVFLVRSDNNGATLSDPASILTESTNYIQTTWWPQLVVDPTDETGKTVYFGSGSMCTRKSIDGGENFMGTYFLSPLMTGRDFQSSSIQIDDAGNVHWLSKGKLLNGDFDIFYGHKKEQPDPGDRNKAHYFETTRNDKFEITIVPSSPSIEFDSVMTGEAWVKFLPGSGLGQNIFSKINGKDGAYYNCPGYHMLFDDYYGKRRFSCGLQTDKGEFINWVENNVTDTLWHHIAFTYDAAAGLNNFKSYFDGLLVAQRTVTGEIIPGDGLLMIGSRESHRNSDSKYMVDDIRLWNRALTQEELLENQNKTFSGNEDSLKLWLNFDDTFKDMSGNGNDAIPLYLGELKASDFDPPVTQFEMYQVANDISFNNKTDNASSYLWNFGNKQTSEQGNPKITYSTPGEYLISLTSQNATTVTSAAGHVTIEGLERIEPSTAGNAGTVTLTVFGGGISPERSSLILRMDDVLITGSDPWSPAPGQLSARFLIQGTEVGKYDVIVRKNSADLVLDKALDIVEAVLPDPWISLSGRGMTLFNMWQTYTLNYGNHGNVDALGFPLNLVISDLPGIEIEFIDFKVEANQYMKTNTPQIVELMDTLYLIVEDYFGPGINGRYYPLYIPVVEANSSHSVHIRVKSPGDFDIEAWTNDPFFETGISNTKSAAAPLDDWPTDKPEDDWKTKLNACIALSAADALASSGMDLLGIFLPVDCVYDFGTLVFNPFDAAKPEHEKGAVMQNWGYALASAAWSCIGDLTPVKTVKIGIKLTAILNNIYKGYHAHQDCLNAFDPRYKNRKKVGARSSFDPNEMVGPSGFGEKNYIARYNMMPYSILFENKSEATAPAHIVTITDTLDLSVFDISDFGFSSFGWDDTIFSLPGSKMKEFSMDIDLRPGLELITRVSGKLDTLTGIVKWEFLSLNPGTLDLEEDPLLGFLPPNVTSPEGEGFVSFSVGLKKELGINDEIRNKASIVFDANQPILTNEYMNTLDLDAPQSQVYPLEATIDSRFPVDWTGNDEGSGVAGYTVYVLKNDTLLYPWLINTAEMTSFFEGEVGSTYKFYSRATDNVSLIETTPDGYDAQTTVTVNVEEFERVKANLSVWPNPAADDLRVTLQNAPCGMYAVELVSATGSVKHSRLYEDTELKNGININVKDCPPGNYVIRLVFGNKTETRKVMVQ